MNLKEAFRYQNFLSRTIDTANAYFMMSRHVTKVTTIHERERACPGAGTEEVETKVNKNIRCESNNDVMDFVLDLLEEKQVLSAAIAAAKKSASIDIDSATSLNKIRQETINVFNYLASLEASERTYMATGYAFNDAKEQKPYSYEAREITTIDFDRNKAKAILKELRTESDKTSTAIDQAMVEIKVMHTPKYDVNASIQETFDTYMEKKK